MVKKNETLKGSLSVLKLMPGTYFSQTGNPLHITREQISLDNRTSPHNTKTSSYK